MNPVIQTEIKRLEAAARAWKRVGKTYKGADAKKMQEAHDEDAADLLAVHDSAKAEDWKHAWTLAGHLDTIVRDQIPTRLYYFLMQKAGAP